MALFIWVHSSIVLVIHLIRYFRTISFEWFEMIWYIRG